MDMVLYQGNAKPLKIKQNENTGVHKMVMARIA